MLSGLKHTTRSFDATTMFPLLSSAILRASSFLSGPMTWRKAMPPPAVGTARSTHPSRLDSHMRPFLSLSTQSMRLAAGDAGLPGVWR